MPHSLSEPSVTRPGCLLRLVCSEIWGGNVAIHTQVELPGVRGVLYSQSCGGGRGGDVHYLSVCGSGLLSRMCLADVVGHGETVATVSQEMHAHLRRAMNEPDQRKVFVTLNRRLEALGLKAMTTAAAASYYAPYRRLSICYAGHPPAWWYEALSRRWQRLLLNDEASGRGEMANGPLAVDAQARFTQRDLQSAVGDRLLIVTDGVLEAPDSSRRMFGEAGVERVLSGGAFTSCDGLVSTLLEAMRSHSGGETVGHDDVSMLAVEIVEGPRGPAIWHAMKNRLLRRRGSGGPVLRSSAPEA